MLASRGLAGLALALCWSPGLAQTVPPPPASTASSPTAPAAAATSSLPDAPSQVQAGQQSVVVVSKQSFSSSGLGLRPCKIVHEKKKKQASFDLEDPTFEEARKLCIDKTNPYDRFLNTTMRIPMTPRQKGYLAFRDVIDPFNLATIVASSAYTVATDSHSAFGPGVKGIGYLSGITYVEDATGEFFGTWLVPSLAHEDPHYHRMPEASIRQRAIHAISRTAIAQSDEGKPMPNYSTMVFYPVTAEIANLYVPGVQTNGRATAARIFTGYASDPIGNLITEFLPDVAKRVHIRIIFVQRILNQVATGQPGTD